MCCPLPYPGWHCWSWVRPWKVFSLFSKSQNTDSLTHSCFYFLNLILILLTFRKLSNNESFNSKPYIRLWTPDTRQQRKSCITLGKLAERFLHFLNFFSELWLSRSSQGLSPVKWLKIGTEEQPRWVGLLQSINSTKLQNKLPTFQARPALPEAPAKRAPRCCPSQRTSLSSPTKIERRGRGKMFTRWGYTEYLTHNPESSSVSSELRTILWKRRIIVLCSTSFTTYSFSHFAQTP